MPGLNVDRLRLEVRPASRLRRWLWREWCFVRALGRRYRAGAPVLALVFVAGITAFLVQQPEGARSVAEATWDTWRLLFGELPDDLPPTRTLEVLAYALPALGLVAVAQGLAELILMLRDRRRNERSWSETMAASSTDHVVLVGLGKLGYRCWRLLDRLGENVVVVERDERAQFLEDVRSAGAAILIGDGRSDRVLEEANVARARSVVLATNDDLANLEMALDARRMNPRVRVVLRLFDQNLANKIREGFDIHIAMSQSALSAPAFAMAAHDPSIVNSFVVDDRLFVMQRWTVREGGPLAGEAVARIRAELGFGVVQLSPASGAPVLYPKDDARLQPGDALLVQGPFEALVSLRERGWAAQLATAPPPPRPAA